MLLDADIQVALLYPACTSVQHARGSAALRDATDSKTRGHQRGGKTFNIRPHLPLPPDRLVERGVQSVEGSQTVSLQSGQRREGGRGGDCSLEVQPWLFGCVPGHEIQLQASIVGKTCISCSPPQLSQATFLRLGSQRGCRKNTSSFSFKLHPSMLQHGWVCLTTHS